MGVRGRKAEAPGLHQGEGCDDRVMVREGGGGGWRGVTRYKTRILHCVIPVGVRCIRFCLLVLGSIHHRRILPPFRTILYTPSTHTSYTPPSRFLPPSCTSTGLRLLSLFLLPADHTAPSIVGLQQPHNFDFTAGTSLYSAFCFIILAAPAMAMSSICIALWFHVRAYSNESCTE